MFSIVKKTYTLTNIIRVYYLGSTMKMSELTSALLLSSLSSVTALTSLASALVFPWKLFLNGQGKCYEMMISKENWINDAKFYFRRLNSNALLKFYIILFSASSPLCQLTRKPPGIRNVLLRYLEWKHEADFVWSQLSSGFFWWNFSASGLYLFCEVYIALLSWRWVEFERNSAFLNPMSRVIEWDVEELWEIKKNICRFYRSLGETCFTLPTFSLVPLPWAASLWCLWFLHCFWIVFAARFCSKASTFSADKYIWAVPPLEPGGFDFTAARVSLWPRQCFWIVFAACVVRKASALLPNELDNESDALRRTPVEDVSGSSFRADASLREDIDEALNVKGQLHFQGKILIETR